MQEPAPSLGDPPDEDDLAADASRFGGQQVKISGTVTSTRPMVVRAHAANGDTLEIRVTGIEQPIETGDSIDVYGTLQDDHTVEVIDFVHKPAWTYWWTRIISLFAVLWVLVRAVRQWYFDLDVVAFRLRLQTLRVAGTQNTYCEEDDA